MLTREMKDTGIEWIGKTPINWAVVRSNLFFYSSTEKVNAEENDKINQLTASQKYGVISQKKYMELESQVPVQKQNLTDLKRVDKDDFVISLRSFEGGIEMAQESGGITPAYTVIKERTKQTNSNYYKYLFKSNMYIQALRGTVLDTIRDGKSIKYNHFSMVPILLPSIQKQETIGRKLDEISENIDSLVRETQQSIEELKKYKQSIITEVVTKGLDPNIEMKDSGIEWIGNIPSHWTVNKMKFVTRVKEVKQDFKKGDIYIGLENVNSFAGRINGFSKLENKSKGNSFDRGDVLYSKLRPYLAKAFIADISGSCSGEFIVFSQYDGEKKHLLYWLISQLFTDYINATSYGAKMPRSSWDYIKETSIPQPPKEEELLIVNYIESMITHIDDLILKKKKIIEELEQYKKSLVYEYVTGKKEV